MGAQKFMASLRFQNFSLERALDFKDTSLISTPTRDK